MKHLSSFLLVVIFAFSANVVNAQMSAINESKERIAELLKIDLSAKCGIESIDNFAAAVKSVADKTSETSNILVSLTDRINNKTDIPTVDELKGVENHIKELSKSVTEAGNLAVEAAKGLKELKNPMKIKGATKSLNDTKKALEIIVKEMEFQVKTIAEMFTSIS